MLMLRIKKNIINKLLLLINNEDQLFLKRMQKVIHVFKEELV